MSITVQSTAVSRQAERDHLIDATRQISAVPRLQHEATALTDGNQLIDKGWDLSMAEITEPSAQEIKASQG